MEEWGIVDGKQMLTVSVATELIDRSMGRGAAVDETVEELLCCSDDGQGYWNTRYMMD